MATFSNLKDLEKYVNQKAKLAMNKGKSVKEVVVDELVISINENIYDEYSPRRYSRQTTDGGLTDRDNFAMDETKDGVAIYSTREATDLQGNEVYAIEIIEGHADYSMPDIYNYGYEKPRHAVDPAREKLRNSGKLVEAMAKDLKSVGIDIK